jgi:hypothetical protein
MVAARVFNSHPWISHAVHDRISVAGNSAGGQRMNVVLAAVFNRHPWIGYVIYEWQIIPRNSAR